MATQEELERYALQMQEAPTQSEKIFRQKLAGAGIHFQFQVIIGGFIVDFLIPNRALVIEIDGSSHDNKLDYDQMRDDYLLKNGFKVLHIKNEAASKYPVEKIKAIPEISLHLQKILEEMAYPAFKAKKDKKKQKPRPKAFSYAIWKILKKLRSFDLSMLEALEQEILDLKVRRHNQKRGISDPLSLEASRRRWDSVLPPANIGWKAIADPLKLP